MKWLSRVVTKYNPSYNYENIKFNKSISYKNFFCYIQNSNKNKRWIYFLFILFFLFFKQIIPPYNLHQMALQEVQLSTSGKYTCQITLDAPPFEFTSRSGYMTVISIPERFPVISGNKGHQNYRLGERVQLNCTCFDTHPPATLKWFINDHQVI